MSLINLIINKSSQNVCYLCFEQSEKSIDICRQIDIEDEIANYSVNLRNVTRYLFPFYAIVTNQACQHCSDLVIKIYKAIKKGLSKLLTIKSIIEKINQEIESKLPIDDSKMYIDLRNSDNENGNNVNGMPNDSIITINNDMKEESKNEALICYLCGKKCKSPSSLQTHIQTHTHKTCPYCQKLLKNNTHYQIHLKNHSKPSKRTKSLYHCHNCLYKTLNKTDLKAHMFKIHLNVKPFVCDICKKGFHKNSNLQEHISTHGNRKKLICEVCGDHFSYEKTLMHHLKLHFNKKPIKCEICGHSFVTNSRKNEHIKRKHSEKTFSCTNCSKSFALKKELNRHIKVNHSD